MTDKSSDDIVAQLRDWSSDFIDRNPLLDSAADEIERLRAQIEHYEWGRKNTQLEMDEREQEIDRLSEPLMHTDKDREYATDLLEDLDIKPTGPQLEIATQWFCKARVERALERGGGKS